MRAEQQPKAEQERLEAERRQREEPERLQAEQREREPLAAQHRERHEKGQRQAERREIEACGGMGADSRPPRSSRTPPKEGATNLKKPRRLLVVIAIGVVACLLGLSLYISYRPKTSRPRPVLAGPLGTPPPPDAPSNSPNATPRVTQASPRPGASGADGLAEAKRHLDAKGYVRALPPLQKAADGGNAEALYRLGRLYENGWDVDQDPAKAGGWYQKAADAGDAETKEALSPLRANRSPIPEVSPSPASQSSPSATPPGAGGLAEAKRYLATKDYAKALPLLQTAALLGDAWGMNQLDVLYDDGHGVVQDYAQAGRWYQKAAQAGNTDAMVNLGSLYYQGHGMAQDDGQARRWYQRAAQAGNADAKRLLLHFGADRLAKAKRYLEAKDYPQARRWYQKAAEAGNVRAKEVLSHLRSK